MNYIDHISLLHIKDKKVLLCVSRGKTKWQLPGGKRKASETDEEALTRECKEELGINILPSSIKLYETIEGQAHSKEDGVVVRIKIFIADFKGEIKEDNEVERVDYLSLQEVPDTSDMGWEYLKKLKAKGLID